LKIVKLTEEYQSLCLIVHSKTITLAVIGIFNDPKIAQEKILSRMKTLEDWQT
jgi:uncharacterized membrane protein YiaA